MKCRPLGWGAMALGLAVLLLAQRVAPIAGQPLYDGVVVSDPYKWLSPPSGLLGGAMGGHDTESLAAVEFAAVTPETPPQAQVIVDTGSLALPEGTTSVTTTLTPVVPPAVAPADGVVAGNVYAISAANQRGEPIPTRPGAAMTVLLRGPPNLSSANIELFSGGTWTALQTDSAGIPDMFTALVGAFGEFALVAPQGWEPAGVRATPTPSPGMPPTVAPTGSVLAESPGTPSPGAARASPPAAPAGAPGGSGPGLPPIVLILLVGLIAGVAGFVAFRPVKRS
jgi:hypothetical protein